MSHSERPLSCKRVRVRLDAQVDGETTPQDAARIDAHLAECAACTNERDAAVRLRDALRALPGRQSRRTALPADMPALRATPIVPLPALPARPTPVATPLRPAASQSSPRRRGAGLWRPLAAAAVLAAIAFGIVRFANRPTEQALTTEDVARAEAQVRWVIARLGDINRRAASRVVDDVLQKDVIVPSARAVESALDATETQ